MTKKQYNTLKPYEQSFKEADCNYYRAIMTSDIEVLSKIYEELGYKLDSKTCSRCILAMLQNLSKEYKTYSDKTKNKKKDND